MEFRPRPKIVTRPRTQEPPETPIAPAAEVAPRFAPVAPGVAGRLLAAGFSAGAANAVANRHPELGDPEQALAEFLASREARYPVEGRTAIITIQGAPGSGRTTALMRMALDCADAGRPAVLVAADSARTGGREQVHAYGEAIGVDVYDAFSPQDLVHVVTAAPKGTCVFVDVPAGRWSPPPMPGVQHFQYAALPAHWNASVVSAHLSGRADTAGVVITFSDLATDLIPAISLVVETGLGIAFLSSGRDVATGIDVADPLTLASGAFTTSSRETTNGRLVATA
jgi:flagellar biosynthesis GTPase FlhF